MSRVNGYSGLAAALPGVLSEAARPARRMRHSRYRQPASGHGRRVRCSSARLSGRGCSRSNAVFRFIEDPRITPGKTLPQKSENFNGFKNALQVFEDAVPLSCSTPTPTRAGERLGLRGSGAARLPLGMWLERAAGLSGARSRRAEPETADFPSPS